ncbi:MAG: hypothetical protein QOJ07_1901, partial [Thermoleophilaceae bacterium]|nr:hypothetical protein [Thermoleophilaceae bacterium]
MFDVLSLPFVQRALLEVVLLAIAGGLVGTWIVLRGLAFYTHAAGTAAFPGLVLADGLGFAAPLGAFATAIVLAGGVAGLTRGRRAGYDSATALVLVGCLAAGVILASDVFHSGARVETLLFGSLLLIEPRDVILAGVAAALVLAGTVSLGPRWLADGFDPDAARAVGLRGRGPDSALLVLVALASTAALAAVGALLATALLIVPAATVRLWTRRLVPWQVASVALAALEGVGGVLLSYETDAPPGATIATLAGGVFLVAALARTVRRARLAPAAAATAALLIALLGAGCGAPGDSGKGLHVVATTTQLADFARAVGGDRVAVAGLLRANTDPHEYEPRPSDVRAIVNARVVLESGDGLDSWIG